MGLFDRMRQVQPLASPKASLAAPDLSAPPTSLVVFIQRACDKALALLGGRWHVLMESCLLGAGVTVLSVLFIWATVTGRVSIEIIVVTMVVLLSAVFTVSYSLTYQTRTLALQERAREAVAKTTQAAEIMMEFLREFTLKNQAVISQLAESQKALVVDDLRRALADCGKSIADPRLRLELTQVEEAIARKIMEIPVGVSLPLPRLEYFDQALHHMQEPERTPQCPSCASTQVRIGELDGREGICYTCVRCGHEFSIGITVMLEKHV